MALQAIAMWRAAANRMQSWRLWPMPSCKGRKGRAGWRWWMRWSKSRTPIVRPGRRKAPRPRWTSLRWFEEKTDARQYVVAGYAGPGHGHARGISLGLERHVRAWNLAAGGSCRGFGSSGAGHLRAMPDLVRCRYPGMACAVARYARLSPEPGFSRSEKRPVG